MEVTNIQSKTGGQNAFVECDDLSLKITREWWEVIYLKLSHVE